MSDKIPIAEEYFDSSNLKISNTTEYQYSKTDVVKAAKKFTQLHVEAALKAASKKAKLTDFASEFLQEGASDAIDTRSILNAYPKENIK